MQRLMMVLHREDADRCISMTTEEQEGRTESKKKNKNDIHRLNMP